MKSLILNNLQLIINYIIVDLKLINYDNIRIF